MRPVKFGLFAPQVGESFATVRERASLADRLGYDSYWVVDHFWSRGLPQLDHLEAWTLLAALAVTTQRIRLGALVTCNSYRNPALVAKMTATLDSISEGRFALGMGAGWMDEEYRSYGYPFPSIGTRIEQLDEALQIIKRMLTEERTTFAGRHYSVDSAVNRPPGVQKPRPPILIGGAGEKRLLRVVAEHADIWNCPNNAAQELDHKLSVLRAHCESANRPFEDIEISEQCVVVLGRDQADLDRKLALARATVGTVFDVDGAGLIGTPAQLIERLEARRKQGVTFFTMLFGDFHQPETLQLFAEEVAPAFR